MYRDKTITGFVGKSGTPYRSVRSSHLSYRQVYAGDRNIPKRGLSAYTGKHQRDTQYYHQFKPAELSVLFSSLFRNSERTLRDEGRVGEN